ncbi:MAG TPA: glycosyltransferase family 2 protein [Pyrinomonadaceae bacterium]|nr:glycosyltransferase family 2 protein [Pyrinomonadaceae bacterium]
MPYDLSIIVVNWNGGSLLTRCVETIVTSAPRTTYEIIVVDNDSKDDSLDQLRASEIAAPLIASGQLRIVVNDENRGFGAANNQAFALTTSPFVFMLNLDTEVRPGTIDKLIEKLKADRTIGACGPKILNSDGSLQVSVFFSPPCVWHTLLSQLWLYHLIPRRMRGELLLGWHWDHDRERAVPMLGGAAIMTRREVLDKVGGFNERFHMYSEDTEWCWRITNSKWRLVFVPDAILIHHGAQSANKRWSPAEQLRVRLRAGFDFEHLALSRWQVAANQLTNYVVVTLQITGRKLLGIQHPELQVIREMHREHLVRSLRNHAAEER